MPKILKRPYQGGGTFDDFFGDRPNFAIELATTMHVWTTIELDLADLLIFLQRGDARALMAVYFSITSLEARLNTLQMIVKNTLPEEFHKQFIALSKNVRKGAKKRNAIAHARWAENGVFPDGIIRLPHAYEVFNKKREVELWRIPDFKEINRELKVLRRQTSAFAHQVYQTHRKKPDKPPSK